MKRTILKAGAAVGVVSVAVLAAGPALAASAPVSQATAQSLNLAIGGTKVVGQQVSAVNNGGKSTVTDTSTIPNLVSALGSNNLLGIGVALQSATAKADGTSFACAGVAGKGSSGLVNVGNKGCDINGAPMTINLSNLDVGSTLLDPTGAISGAIAATPVGGLLNTLLKQLQANLISSLSSALKPLGVSLGGSLSAIEGTCSATPTAATGAAHLVDTQGGSNNTPVTLNVAGQKLTLLDLPANPKPNTKLIADLKGTTQMLTDALQTEVKNALANGALAGLAPVLASAQTAILDQLTTQLKPLTDALSKYVIEADLNTQVSSDAGRKIDVTAFDLHVLPGATAVTGFDLANVLVGRVTCGPNTKPGGPVTPTPTPTKTPTGHVPTGIESGLSGGSNTGTIIAAMSVLLAAGGAAGT
ncbi:MAG: hypothetical protein ACTHJM_10130, partial [Marmoricola sp.]